MQIPMTKEEIDVVRMIIGDKRLREAVFTCQDCRHFHQHYIREFPHTPDCLMRYTRVCSGHCGNRLVRSNTKACQRFEANVALEKEEVRW